MTAFCHPSKIDQWGNKEWFHICRKRPIKCIERRHMMERELPKQLLVTPAQGVVQHIATQLQHTAPRHPSTWSTTHCNALQHNCDTLQLTASRHPSTRCATRCNALQHLNTHHSVKRDLPRVKRDLDSVNYKH